VIQGDSDRVRVLLLHDPEAPSPAALARQLRSEGLDVLLAPGDAHALRRWALGRPHVVLIESSKADDDLLGTEPRATAERNGALVWDGLAMCTQIRKAGVTPIAVLGVGQADDQVLRAYGAGADAYIAAPSHPAVLAARLVAMARAAASRGEGPATARDADRILQHRPAPQLQISHWILDPSTREVRSAGDAAVPEAATPLTPSEFRVLYLLAANAGRVVPSGRLAEYAGAARVRSLVSRLRRKLALPETGQGAIVSHPGLGYRYAGEVVEVQDSYS
jgi:DNA-binding response OmpR family regulator